MSENPYQSPDLNSQRLGARFPIVRTIASGIGFAGILLAILPYFMSMSSSISARCEIVGGAMAMFAGAAFLFTGATMNRNSLPRVPLSSFLLTVLFGLVGLNFFAKGYAIESADLRRFDKAKTNLEALKEAVDRNKSSPHESGYPD